MVFFLNPVYTIYRRIGITLNFLSSHYTVVDDRAVPIIALKRPGALL